MKITGIGHTGITVKNLEESIKFYNGILGFKVDHAPCDMVEDQEESKGLGVPGSIHRICQLEVVEGQYIELMEFAGVPSPNDEPLPLNQIGSQHISFVVDNLVSWVEKLNSHGIQFLYKPVPYYNPDESVSWWALFKDPDGIIVELLQL